MGKPWTPEMIADRWMCSGETVRQMIRDGRLPAFRVGRMMRVTNQALEEYECKTSGSDASTTALSSCGTSRTAPADAIVLRHTRPKTQNAKRAIES
ncbi:excisionase family DNA-binding protein [Falsirhodobacter halotolerans]|uniref:excisionase family DNA-binding protein n=1 Tax=Falsirhodobacter halotolerans TaxID=1146892 RepID=UPI003CC7F7D3